MKTLRKYFVFNVLLLSMLTILNSSCEKETNKEIVLYLTTAPIKNITETSVVSGGEISEDVSSPVSIRGVCWSTNPNPTVANNKITNGSGTGIFESHITGLSANTTYYIKAYATNNEGTAYGDEITFKTIGPVTDIDGNVYQSICIGNQVWMTQNLNTSKYRNGDPIQLVTDVNQWGGLSTGAYCNYDNNSSNSNTYGRLYNWYALIDQRNICPIGWHIPSKGEWETLINYLGGESVAGGKLKETGTSHWESPNEGATNESGFTALPAGSLYSEWYNGYWYGYFDSQIGSSCNFWSSTEAESYDPVNGTHVVWFYTLSSYSTNIEGISHYMYYLGGYSIRCIRD
jgi:uncharacterized protein (TIGR02145 family)